MANTRKDMRTVVEVASCPNLNKKEQPDPKYFPKEPIYAIPISKTSAINIHMLFDPRQQGRQIVPNVAPPKNKQANVVQVDPTYSSIIRSEPSITVNGTSSTQLPNTDPQLNTAAQPTVTANGVTVNGHDKPAFSRSVSEDVTVNAPATVMKPLAKSGSLDSPTTPPSVQDRPLFPSTPPEMDEQTPPPPLPPPPMPPSPPAVNYSKQFQTSPPTTPKEDPKKPKVDVISELKAKQELLKAYYSKPEVLKPENKFSPKVSPRVSPEPKDMVRPESEADSESATWTSLEDSHSEMSSNSSSAGFENDSACSVTGSEDREDTLNTERVALVSDSTMAVLVQFTCDSRETAKKKKFITTVVDIANTCANYFRKKESKKLNSTQLGQLVMPDRRQVTDHVKDAEKEFSDNISISKAICLHAKDRYIGSSITGTEVVRGRCTVGKSAVAVLLKKINRIAPAEEFAEQLCQHILKARPTEMGSRANLNIQLEKERKSRREKLAQPDTHLLGQTFIPDPTITVWEAAKRSFVDIEDFILV